MLPFTKQGSQEEDISLIGSIALEKTLMLGGIGGRRRRGGQRMRWLDGTQKASPNLRHRQAHAQNKGLNRDSRLQTFPLR